MKLPQLSDLRGPIALGTVRTSGALGLRLAVQAGTLLLVARMLGPEQFGAFSGVAALAVVLGTLSTFGTHLVLLGEVSKDPARRDEVLCYAVPLTLLCGSALLTVYLLICTTVLSHAGVSIVVLAGIGIAETLLQPLFGLMASEHHALGRIARAQLLQTAPLALRLVVAMSVFLMQMPDPLAAYAFGYFASSALALVLGVTTLPAAWPGPSRWRLLQMGEFNEALGFAAINITKTGPAELDKTLAATLLPLASAGVYSAAARVIGAITLPITAMTLSALPRLFREGQGQPQRTRRLLRWMFATALSYSIVLAGALWLIAPVFVWVFGTKYGDLDLMVRWLCIAIPGMALRLTAGNVLMAMGKPWMRVGFEATGLLVLIVASALLALRLGMIGMPLALGCSEWAMALGGALLVYWVTRNSNADVK